MTREEHNKNMKRHIEHSFYGLYVKKKKWLLTVYWSSGKVSTTFQFDSFKAAATLINASIEVSNITGIPIIDKYKLKYVEVV